MDYKKSKIQIAGAGAGKTYSMAEQILEYDKFNSENKDIIAITYTNTAKENIYKKVYEKESKIPERLKIYTIHSFLLEYIIYPYSKYVLGKSYKKAVSIPLPDNFMFRNKKISDLEKKEIIHNEVVFNKAKQIIVSSKSELKLTKLKKEIVLKHIMSSISAIFIDESQDLDDDVLRIMEKLSDSKIFIYMVGDPKQALKYPGKFEEFTKNIKEKQQYNFECLENNNITRRLPKSHVNISNLICSDDQKQTTLNENNGRIYYTYSDDVNFNEIYKFFQNEDSICYIKTKTTKFNTQHNRKLDSDILKDIIIDRNINDDEDAFLYEKEKELYKLIDENNNIELGLKVFLRKYNLRLKREIYAQIISSLEDSNSIEYNVYSIDKVKGLERKNCMFIINESLLNYLLGNKTERNKEMNYLYVGLTRSTDTLLLVIDVSTLKKLDKSKIDTVMTKFNIEKYNWQ